VSKVTDEMFKDASKALSGLTDRFNDFFRIQRRGLGLFSTQVRGGIIAPLEKLEVLTPRVMDTLDFRAIQPKNVEGIFNTLLKSTASARASGQTTLKDFEEFGKHARNIISDMNLITVTGYIPSMRTAKVWVKTNDSVLTQFRKSVASNITAARNQLFSLGNAFKNAGVAIRSFGSNVLDASSIIVTAFYAIGEASLGALGTFGDLIAGARGALQGLLSEGIMVGRGIRSALNKPIVDVLRHYDVQLYALRKRLSTAIVDIAGLPFAAIGKAVSFHGNPILIYVYRCWK